jgi:hypothetical protein
VPCSWRPLSAYHSVSAFHSLQCAHLCQIRAWVAQNWNQSRLGGDFVTRFCNAEKGLSPMQRGSRAPCNVTHGAIRKVAAESIQPGEERSSTTFRFLDLRSFSLSLDNGVLSSVFVIQNSNRNISLILGWCSLPCVCHSEQQQKHVAHPRLGFPRHFCGQFYLPPPPCTWSWRPLSHPR